MNQLLNESFNNNHSFFKYDSDKFIEIASSLAYYLKFFSSLKKFLEYISLVISYLIEQEFSILIPLNEKGNIWVDNVYCFKNTNFLEINSEITNFLKESKTLNNFKIKDSLIIENFLKTKFPDFSIIPNKLVSRGKCRGFLFIFQDKSKSYDSYIQERNISFLLNILAVGIENYLLISINKKHENVDREISSGAEIQSRLLPDYCPKIYGVDLAAHCRPALQLGGDYYDFMSIKPNLEETRRQKGRWALVIGDVMGKGIPAGLLMTMLRGMLRAEVLTGLPPDRILHDLNQLAISDLDQSHRFVTLFYSDFDPRTKKLRYANAAHNPPLLWSSLENKVIRLDTEGFVIGLQKDAEYQCGSVNLSNSDVILYYTDGITETANELGERFGEYNLIKSFDELCNKNISSKEILDSLFNRLDKFAGNKKKLDDDASIVIFKLQ